jgi:hypothetical protein
MNPVATTTRMVACRSSTDSGRWPGPRKTPSLGCECSGNDIFSGPVFPLRFRCFGPPPETDLLGGWVRARTVADSRVSNGTNCKGGNYEPQKSFHDLRLGCRRRGHCPDGCRRRPGPAPRPRSRRSRTRRSRRRCEPERSWPGSHAACADSGGDAPCQSTGSGAADQHALSDAARQYAVGNAAREHAIRNSADYCAEHAP